MSQGTKRRQQKIKKVLGGRCLIRERLREGIVLADLSRSFLVRKNADASFAPVTVDLEALFLRGDLAQNQAMAPDDYLYFMPSDTPEVYILGEVAGPGNLPYAANLSVLRAIAGRGGFMPKAYRSRVLVVRGSLSQPETFIVNTADILAGRAPDFKLEPRDIVYVSRRPWALAEELLEAAVTDFTRAVLVSWTGANIGPFIKKPVF
ncbi:MAG: hypothetical protein EXS31_15365 [Pedosphaera sp.]|nr:hypothetical protein [Pedosphaera sp.]